MLSYLLAILSIACMFVSPASATWSRSYDPAWGDEGRTAPDSIVDDIAVVYENHLDVPSRSGNPSLIGPVQFLRRAIIDENAKEATIPLYAGHNADGTTAWYILTETTNKEIAEQDGLTFSAKLRYTDQGHAVRTATFDNAGAFIFSGGAVDFSPVQTIVPGPESAPFPLTSFQPGSVGDATYTPIVRTSDGIYWNAPVIAFNVSAATLQQFASGNVDHRLVHDKVVRINPAERSVTVMLTNGFSFNKPIFYLSTDATDPQLATLESSTFAPALASANQTVFDIDSIPGQGNERLALFVNGPQNPLPGVIHPWRQGLFSAIDDGRDPLNVFGGIPTVNLDYSPIWDVFFLQWTHQAIAEHYRFRITSFIPDVASIAAKGLIEAYGGGAIHRSGVLINCPVFSRLV